MSAWQHQQARIGKESRQLDGVFEPGDVPIAGDDEGRCADAANRGVRHIRERRHACRILVVHGLQLVRIGSDGQECILEGLRHVRDVGLFDEFSELRLRAVASGQG